MMQGSFDPPLLTLPAVPGVQLTSLSGLDPMAEHYPHRNEFYSLFWVQDGDGECFCSYHRFALLPGRLFLFHPGQVLCTNIFPTAGWLIHFNQEMFAHFLGLNPHQELAGLMDPLARQPYVDMKISQHTAFGHSLELLRTELSKDEPPNDRIIKHLLSILLLYANEVHPGSLLATDMGQPAAQMRQLRSLLNQYFMDHRDTGFYRKCIGLLPRELNDLCKQFAKKPFEELLLERLVAESETLLSGTNRSLQGIAQDLGFSSEAHFSAVFVKYNMLSPAGFRDRAYQILGSSKAGK